MSKAVAMMNRSELKQFKADFEIVQTSLDAALGYLDAEERYAAACDDLATRWQATLDCGTAMKRIHDTRSYRDAYADWGAFCRAAKVSRAHSYRLMKCAEVLAAFPPALIGKQELPLSFRLLGELGKLDKEERAAVIEAAANGPGAEAAFEHLKMRRPKQQSGSDMDRLRRWTAVIEDWFADFGSEKAVHPLIYDLLTMAEKLVAAAKAAA